jgi:hypothetical protein
MSASSEKRLTEWAVWFTEHKNTILNNPDPDQAKAFMMLALDGLLEITAMLAKDIQELEHRKGIILPKGILLHEQLR